MSITATVTSSPITATASASSVAAAVSSSSVTASASGGVGPQGPIGNTGASGGGATQMSELSDVLFTSLAANDVLRYSASKWRNYPETSVTDGGNF